MSIPTQMSLSGFVATDPQLTHTRDDVARCYMRIGVEHSRKETDGTFTIEYRAGAPNRHFETVAADLRTTFRVLTGWAADTPGWRGSCNWRQWPIP